MHASTRLKMSPRKENLIEKKGFVDTEFSSGDYNKKSNCKQQYQEENNNEVNELAEVLEMGCIVDAVKRPPNVCVETCVYEESDTEASQYEIDEDDAYSDEFEDEKSDGEESIKIESKSAKSETSNRPEDETSVKLSKSHSFMSHKPSVSGRSGKSSSLNGSLKVPQTRRINMSFSNERLREIERHNHILLSKILSARNNKKSSIPAPAPLRAEMKRPQPSAALHRKNQQRQIDHENMILLRKIQRAKSSACSIRR